MNVYKVKIRRLPICTPRNVYGYVIREIYIVAIDMVSAIDSAEVRAMMDMNNDKIVSIEEMV